MDFGQRVKELRRKHKLTKEEFCGDETELSVRQLTRIESGQSTPTLAKVEFIAQRLGVKIGELTDDNFELPTRYKEIKFILLRGQTFRDPEKIALRERYFEEIFEYYYDILPEEEQLVVDVMNSHLELSVTDESFIADKILKEYLEQTLAKETYAVNDLILIDLYLFHLNLSDFSASFYHPEQYAQITKNLLRHVDILPIEELFVLNKILTSLFGNALDLKDAETMARIIAVMEKITQQTLDFHKTATLNLMKWKFALFYQNDSEMADNYFKSACLFAELTQDKHLLANLKREWQKDFKHFLSK